MIDAEARTIIRTLRDVLMSARAHVEAAEEHYRDLLLDDSRASAAEALDRLDDAVVAADEVLS